MVRVAPASQHHPNAHCRVGGFRQYVLSERAAETVAAGIPPLFRYPNGPTVARSTPTTINATASPTTSKAPRLNTATP